MGISYCFILGNLTIHREYEVVKSLGEVQGIRRICIDLLIAI